MTTRVSGRAFVLGILTVFAVAGRVQAQSQETCTMAGTSVRVESAESGAGRRTVTYTVINNRRESIQWVRIGSGGHTQTRVVQEQRPDIVTSPGLWRGAVVYPEGTHQFHMQWEAMDAAAALPSRSRATFGIEVNGPEAVPRGQPGPDGKPIQPLYLPTLPFTVGGKDGECWWGWTIAPGDHSPVGGLAAGTTLAVVRPFTDGDRDYVIVDAPAFENHLRLANGLYLTVPITFSWGVKGGFSHNASIGVGLRWSPVEYVSVYAQTHIGTFFFTNRTNLRHVGVDVNIPRYTASSSGTIRRDEYLVFGVEYFDRNAVEVAGYMDGPQWYAGGRGIAVRVGIRAVAWDR